MIELAVALAYASALAFCAHRFSRAIEAFAPKGGLKDSPQVTVEIPEDLMALAMSETESWAQEEVARVVREKHDILKDWNRVRAAMGIGRID